MKYQFLIRKKKPKYRAHIWEGTDTACHMWLSNGIKSKPAWKVYPELLNRGVCKVCKRMSKNFHYIAEENKKSLTNQDNGIDIFTKIKQKKNTQPSLFDEVWLDKYRKVRYQVFLREGRICRLCSHTGSANNPLQIDHIKPKSKFPELSLDPSNMQVLCKDCNYGKSTWDETDWRQS